MIKRLIILIFIVIAYNSLAQDPSFSQIDNKSMFMNPALCGSSGYPKLLISRREQWKGINGSGSQISIGGNSPFTYSLLEASTGLYGDNNRIGGIKAFNFGISFLAEDNLIDPDLEGGVFLNRVDYSGYVSFLVKLDNIRSLRKYRWLQQKYMQFGMSFGGTTFGLDAQNLVFSNMIDAYGGTYPLVTNLPYNSVEKKIFPRFSTGVVFSMLGNNSSTKLNRTIIGYSFQTLNENFQYSTSLTKKHTFHFEHKGTIPTWKQKLIPHWKIFGKSEHYKTDGWISRKYELGQSLDIGQYSPLEIGHFFRFSSNLDNNRNDLHFQTYIPFIRLNLLGRNHGWEISYIYYEYERSLNNKEWLYIGNTGTTHEISLVIHLWGGKGASECIEHGVIKNNGLFQDLKNNGMLRQ